MCFVCYSFPRSLRPLEAYIPKGSQAGVELGELKRHVAQTKKKKKKTREVGREQRREKE